MINMFEIVRFLRDTCGAIAVNGGIIAADIAKYSAPELLRDGSTITVRAVSRMTAPICSRRASSAGPFIAFHCVKRHFTRRSCVLCRCRLSNMSHSPRRSRNGRATIVAARYVVTALGTAEVAFLVVDQFQGGY
jgi:hypothetical protein